MKYLANENIPLGSVVILQKEGVDIRSVRDVLPGARDEEVLGFSIQEGRILITFDKDFGELVFRGKRVGAKGIILLRINPRSEVYITQELRGLLKKEIDFEKHFTVVDEEKIRVVPL